jgi:hypothetical protein
MAKDKHHHYRTCRDEDCPRPLCIAYKDGFDDGFDAGQSAEADE